MVPLFISRQPVGSWSHLVGTQISGTTIGIAYGHYSHRALRLLTTCTVSQEIFSEQKEEDLTPRAEIRMSQVRALGTNIKGFSPVSVDIWWLDDLGWPIHMTGSELVFGLGDLILPHVATHYPAGQPWLVHMVVSGFEEEQESKPQCISDFSVCASHLIMSHWAKESHGQAQIQVVKKQISLFTGGEESLVKLLQILLTQGATVEQSPRRPSHLTS